MWGKPMSGEGIHREPSMEQEGIGIDGTLLALDNIEVELPLAGLGSRTLAAILDYLLLSCLLFICLFGMIFLAGALSLGEGWAAAIILVLLFVLQWTYFFAQEIYWEGRTVGKMAAKLRVVDATGGRATNGALVLRNLVRQVDLLTGIPSMAIDRRSRRLGDLVAGTLVIHDRDPRPALELQRLPSHWGAADIAVTEALLARAPELESHRADEMALRLLRRLDAENPELLADVPQGISPLAALGTALRAIDQHQIPMS